MTPKRGQKFREDAYNFPNLLTLIRIFLIPVFLWFLAKGDAISCYWAAWIYSVSAITDFFDGWLARRQGLNSVVGKFLDPLADKLLVMAALVQMAAMNRVPAWAVILILVRELSITSLRVIAMGEGITIAAGRGGKDKTAVQMVAILMLILHYSYHLNYLFFDIDVDFNAVGMVLLYLSVYFAVTSAVEYVRAFMKAIDAKED